MRARPAAAALLAFTLLQSPALAGSAGVSDGSLSGQVLDPDGSPVSGVFVVAQRTDSEPRVIRSTRTDSQGQFYMGVPTGAYILGFSARGFETIDTAEGATNSRTALGAQVRAFVEPGRNSVVQPLSLSPVPPQGAGTVAVGVTDALTGEPVLQATVIVGTSATSASDGQGSYTLDVPARIGGDGEILPVPVSIQADGFAPFTSELKVVPNQTQRVTLPVQPRLVILSGFVDLDPSLPVERVQDIRVVVDGVPDAISQGRVLADSGYFEVQVPASTGSRTRLFDLGFVLRGAQFTRLTNVAAPRGGSRSVASAGVQVEAIKTDVTGQVVSQDGSVPQGGRITQATLVELGRAVPVSGGTFSLSGVPVGRPLTLEVTVENPTTGQLETGTLSFTATEGADGGFRLPPIVTRPR